MKRSHMPPTNWRVTGCIAAGAALFLAYFFLVITPRGDAYRRSIQSLQPETIKRIAVTLDGQENAHRDLRPDEVSELLRLVACARPYSPNHPNAQWSCYVEISTTTAVPSFTFLVVHTNNDGTQIELYSHGRNGWNYGVLRNDKLAAFVAKAFSEPR